MVHFINPFSDWGFKRIFGQEISKDLLASFLNDLFAGEFSIKSLSFENKEQIGLTKDSREVVFDIYCKTDDNRDIIVEMQNRGQEHFIDRALYYSSRAIVNQGQKGKWDYALYPVYTVCFMNFIDPLLPSRKMRTDLVLADRDTGKAISDRLRIIYLTLPLFNKEEDECHTDFERWIFVLKNMNTFERMPFMAKNAVFKKLAEISDLRTLSKKDMEKYESSIRIMRDTYATYKYAIKQGHQEGMAQGFKEGIEKGTKEGIEKGIEKGEQRKAIDIAKKLKDIGLPTDQIMQATGLSEAEVNDAK